MTQSTARKTTRTTVLAKQAAAVTILAIALSAGLALPANAVTAMVIDFSADGYTVGLHSPDGENGWTGGGTDWDYGLVENSSLPASGLSEGRSLRTSNAVYPPSSRYLQSPEIETAGEPGSGAAWNTFETRFTVTSATGAVQPGLITDVNIDAASRYGGVLNLRETDSGLEIGSYWVPEDATSVDVASWRSAVFVTVDPTVSHEIYAKAIFRADASDILEVYVDGVLVSGDSGATTWEHYQRLANPGGSKVVDEISFRPSSSAPSADGIGYQSGLPAAPATDGLGFLFSDISYAVTNTTEPTPTPTPTPSPTPTPTASTPGLPVEPPPLPPAVDPSPDTSIDLPADTAEPGESLLFSASGFAPNEFVFATIYSSPVFAGWFQADASGNVSGTVLLPSSLDAGTHSLQLTGQTSGWTAVSTFDIIGLASSGADATIPVALAGALLLAGSAAVLANARRRRIRS